MSAKTPHSSLPMRPFFNRDLSWMAFNDRVLEEAQDTRYPLLERLKFVAIVSSNLDEFFSIRVAGLERALRRNSQAKKDDGMKVSEILPQIREWALAQKTRQGTVLREILELLKERGLCLETQAAQLKEEYLRQAEKLLPHMKILLFDNLEGINQLAGGHIYVFIRFKDRFAVVTWPDHFDRLIRLPDEAADVKFHFVLAEKLIVAAASHFFPGETILETFPFKLIRDADVEIDPETDPEELLSTVEEAILSRARRPVVRLEIDAPTISDGALLLSKAFKLHPRLVYRYDVPLDLKILWRLHGLEEFESLRFPIVASKTRRFYQRVPDLVKIVRGQDILLHHPYDSFDTVVQLLHAAAQDPNVVAIRQTLYRTGRHSPIVDGLIEAAKNGKRVTVLIELRARFDEERNIELAKELRKVGVTVVKGFSDKKIHCKITQILRREGKELTSFVHVGTGNYNPNTARLYTDLGLLTANKSFGRDAEKLFKSVQAGRIPRSFESFVAAPVTLHKKLLTWIRHETQRAQKGDKNARIMAKINALVDVKLVQALYKASQAGVKIDLIVRGACMLRPGVPGLSENIRVISIVDKYLEHSRIYFFQNGDHPLVYLSSADWMSRNFHTRLEIAFPVYDPDLKQFIRGTVLESYFKDNQKARQLMPDGQWVRIQPGPNEAPFRAQEMFDRLAASNYKDTPLFTRFVLQRDDHLSIPDIPAKTL
jgi:polyphosphate kinase